MLTIAYTTSRRDPKIQWFFESLERETGGNYDGIEVIAVDLNFGIPNRHPPCKIPPCFRHVAPKPNVWQGPSRLTREDWFAVANTRNTALCYAKGDWIAFVDDLSVLVPGWLRAVREAMAGPKRITCGAYQKVRKLVVEGGEIKGYDIFPQGLDNRMRAAGPSAIDGPVDCNGRWMYGCSMLGPVNAFLSINGYDERCDGLGFEDCITGIHLENRGFKFVYDMRMKTLESEEDHHTGVVMKRSDYGVSPKDKSHKILDLAIKGSGWCPNVFGAFPNLAALRTHIQAGGSFPKAREPVKEWFTGTPLNQL